RRSRTNPARRTSDQQVHTLRRTAPAERGGRSAARGRWSSGAAAGRAGLRCESFAGACSGARGCRGGSRVLRRRLQGRLPQVSWWEVSSRQRAALGGAGGRIGSKGEHRLVEPGRSTARAAAQVSSSGGGRPPAGQVEGPLTAAG